MSTLRSLGRWGLVLAGIWLILTGIGILGIFTVPTVIMGLLALVAGILILFAT